MANNVVHFNMIVDINRILKNKGIEYSIHTIGGCSCAGLKIKQDGSPHDINEIVSIINEYLKNKYLRVVLNNQNTLKVESTFDR